MGTGFVDIHFSILTFKSLVLFFRLFVLYTILVIFVRNGFSI